ncbi:hypothetical protein IT412_05165 [Candidatus Peregrinibacteria bacterium]|nr:hypothetical protein [Candidatus Peregrinibacteria bacterium]
MDLKENKSRHNLKITLMLISLMMIGDVWSGFSAGLAVDSPGSEPIPIKVEGTKPVVDAVTSAKCATDLAAYADPEFENYKTFMENHFKNKSNTASLMDLAMQRYDQFKLNIMQKYQALVGSQLLLAVNSGAGNSAQAEKIVGCESLALDYINNASKILQMRAISTSNIKKTSIFVEKYKQINGKLRVMDQEVMKMVTNMSSFEQKLPCYLKTCVK